MAANVWSAEGIGVPSLLEHAGLLRLEAFPRSVVSEKVVMVETKHSAVYD